MKKMITVQFDLPESARNTPLVIQYRGTDGQVHYWNVNTTKINYTDKEDKTHGTEHCRIIKHRP